MNDEYLWNKTGTDPEIENLEKALAVFRHREAAPPAIVTAGVPAEKRGRFRISFAFAFASIAVVATLAALWLGRVGDNFRLESADEIVFVQESADASATDAGPIVEPKESPRLTPDAQGRPARTNPKRNIIVTSAALRRPKTKDIAPKESIAALTAEERFAYRQLMLALSITSSKLKIVQDTIDGTGTTEDNASKNQR